MALLENCDDVLRTYEGFKFSTPDSQGIIDIHLNIMLSVK